MDLEPVLVALLSNDNQVRKAAEDVIKAQSAQPDIIPALLAQAKQAADPQVRQLAAVLLRKRVGKHWMKGLAPEARQQLQAVLLEQIVHEPLHMVRRAVAGVVGAVAKHAVPKGEWNELLSFLHQCSQSPNAEHREIALLLFMALTETIGDCLQPHMLSLQAVVSGGLGDQAEAVRVAALRAVEPLAQLVGGEPEVKAFHGLLGNVLQLAASALAAGDAGEDTLLLVLQLLVELLENPAPLVQPHLGPIVELAMAVAGAAGRELEVREHGLQVLHWAARYKPKQLAKNKALLRAVIHGLCSMCCEPVPPELQAQQQAQQQGHAAGHSRDEEGVQLPARALAAQALDSIALNVASSHVFPQILEFAQSCAGSSSPQQRHAAQVVLATCSEGCAEHFQRRLRDVLPLVVRGMQDPDREVRGAAAFAIGQLSEYAQPNILQHYDTVLPRVFEVMADPSPDVQERACYALDMFCENLEGEILPYLPQLMERLLAVVAQGSPAVQEVALSAISSTVAAAGKSFEAFVGPLVPLLLQYLGHSSQEALACRVQATECFGLLLQFCGADRGSIVGPGLPPSGVPLRAVVPRLMELALQGCQEQQGLREVSHGMFTCVAKALGTGFVPYLQYVVPLALQSCQQDDGDFEGSESEDDDEAGPGHESDDSDEEGGPGHFSIRTGVLDEKHAAARALGVYAEECPSAFVPWLEQSVQVVEDMAGYFHEEIRAQANESFAQLTISAHKAFPPPAPGALSPEATAVLSKAGPALLKALTEDPEREVVSSAFAALHSLLKGVGAGQLQGAVEPLARVAREVLAGEAKCQVEAAEADEGEEDDEDGGCEIEEELLASALEILPQLAVAVGVDAFAPVFCAQHLPALLGRIKPQQPDGVRSLAVGGLGDICKAIKSHLSPHLAKIMPPVLRELRAEDPVNRQNAAFCAGVLAEGCGAAMAPFLQQLLQALHPLFGPEEDAGTRDNAAGAVARIMLALPGALPLDQVLPVFLSALPLAEDHDEAEPVCQALCGLLAGGDSAAQQVAAAHLPRILQIFGAVVVQEAVALPVRASVAACVRQVVGAYPAQVQPLLGALPAEQQAALMQLGQQQ